MGSIVDAFNGKSVIVTGAGSGIGRQIALQTASAGATVLVTDVVDAIDDVAGEITAAGGKASAMKVDVSDRDAVAAAVDAVVAEHGSLDYIFNNAGVAIFGEFEELTLDDWDLTIDVNLKGVAYGAKLAYDQMVKQGGGHIVSTASIAGLIPVPLQANYVATKHAVVGLHKTMELEAPDHNIKSTVFCPGFVATGMMTNNTLRGSIKGVDARKMTPVPPLSAEKAVQRLLNGVASGKRIVATPFYGRVGWWIERLSLPLSQKMHRLSLKELRRKAKKQR